ncbi:MAG: hypothetical protein D6718_06265 [Acidobacteria bacterium]|nr:MAG: hypothetical protein D6718_06265 [Acidobacteriota bacterium]
MRACACCGAPFHSRQPDPLARCEFCGALLAVDASGAHAPLEARLRVSERDAWRRLLAALGDGARRAWQPYESALIWYPFARGDDPRRPLVPLAVLPPLLERAWHASGADLIEAGPEPEAGGRRVAPSRGVPADRPVVYYPFHRLVLLRGEERFAAWCDGIDGELLLPDDLVPRPETRRRSLARWWGPALAAGAAAGLLLPAGPGLLAATAVAAGFAWKAGRKR